ncbi:hypothetical protein [Mycobacterium sp.]|uniref:hypothetical protein n=1 Tax=Mycobacterium sp. TaxID=1785 RepID=UPI003F959937
MTIWQAPIPTPYQVPHWVWAGSPDNIDTKTGNHVEIWNSPVLQPVQGWDILDSVVLPAMQREEKYSMFLMVPPDFWPNIRDRFGFPIPSNESTFPTTMFQPSGRVSPGVFEVVGFDLESNGMTGFRPGNIVLLRDLE